MNYLKHVHGGTIQMTVLKKIINRKVFIAVQLCVLIGPLLIIDIASAATLKTKKANLVYQLKGDKALKFSFPSDVSSNSKQIAVLDGGNHRVVVFDKKGKHLHSFGEFGNEAGQLNYPTGLFINKENIFVADSGNNRIQIYDVNGKYIRGFNVKSNGKPVRPIDLIAHSKSGKIIVSANQSHNLIVYSSDGKLLQQWGGGGMNKGEFRYPATIAEMSDGRIAVVDVLNTRVQVFNQDGKFSMSISGWGVLQGQLVRPKGVAIDHKGNFYVSDSYMNVVQIFSQTGDFISVLGSSGKPYKMTTPVGMVVDNNYLYVVEMRANRVSVYQL